MQQQCNMIIKTHSQKSKTMTNTMLIVQTKFQTNKRTIRIKHKLIQTKQKQEKIQVIILKKNKNIKKNQKE